VARAKMSQSKHLYGQNAERWSACQGKIVITR
jgi:hypothetical protein